MSTKDKIEALFAEKRPGYSLPRALYLDSAAYDFDLEAIFERHWLQAGLEAEIPQPGDYFTFEVGPSAVIVVRQADGAIGGFFNTCRHRGAQICHEAQGHVKHLVCPYHQWCYDLSGKLLRAGRMHPGFKSEDHSLAPVRVETLAGLIFVCLSEEAPDFTPLRTALGPMLEPYELKNTKVAHTAILVERANWKLVMENARECYHCRGGHPQLMRTFSDFATVEGEKRIDQWLDELEARGSLKNVRHGLGVGPWFEIHRFPLVDGAVSYTMDGKSAVAKTLGRVGEADVGVLWWGIQPNGFNHIARDYAMFFQALPTAPWETTVKAKWLVHRDAVEGVDYDLGKLIEVWNETHNQDRLLAENAQRGVASIGYRPGPYSQVTEQLLLRFVAWYCATVERFLAQ